jgi:hypothetical protein
MLRLPSCLLSVTAGIFWYKIAVSGFLAYNNYENSDIFSQ